MIDRPPAASPPPDITVLILTYNEEIHLERAIRSVRPFAARVIVIDSFSTDRTVEIARAAGAAVLQNRFVNQARQFQWALDHVPAATEWVLRLDADEVIEPDLAAEIARRLPLLDADVTGVSFNRKHIFMGRWIRHGGRYPLTLLRLFRAGQGEMEDRWMDEHIVVRSGRVVTFAGGFADHNLNDIAYFTDKHNRYATREAVASILERHRVPVARGGEGVDRANSARQTWIKRWIKDRLYARMPALLAPFLYFTYRYVVQLGFLDGRQGLIYHMLQGFWYRFLVASRRIELEWQLRDVANDADLKAGLSRLTGLDV